MTPDAGAPSQPPVPAVRPPATARLVDDQRAHEQRLRARPTLEERIRQEEADRIISEARWFALAFLGSVCLCFLIYAVL